MATMKKRAISSKSDAEPGKKQRHWSEGLLETMEDPESKIKEDDRVIVIKDKYPKSQHHYLVVPKDDIASIKVLTKEHEGLVRHMVKIAHEVAEEQPDHEFAIGFHAVPSMYRLHLHVLSTDFNSPCLKNKHHWNSFTTPFFRSPDDVLKELHEHGRVKQMSSIDREKHLKKDLQCHKCSYGPKNIPDLKKHLLTHLTTK